MDGVAEDLTSNHIGSLMDILVIGGTRFFGRSTVEQLLAAGHKVAIFSRGNVRPPFWDDIEHIAGDRDSYQYLAESIRRFPEPDALADEMSAAGFDNVTYRSLSGGIVAIHSGWRI